MRFAPWLLIAAAPLAAQTPPCDVTLDSLRARIERNYSGVQLEVTGDRRQEFDAFYRDLVASTIGASGDACHERLERLTDWFDDPHLFVFQSGRVDSAEAARRRSALRITGITEPRARVELDARRTTLDPIEGIWYDRDGLRVAVLPDTPPGTFVAVVLTSDTISWPVGAVRAILRRVTDDEHGSGARYAVTMQDRNFATRRLRGTLHKDVILRLSPGIWAKEYPVPSIGGLVDARVPHKPTLVQRGGTIIISMVSHDPAYRGTLDSLVRANREAIEAAVRLIVDLRGNEGGASFTSNSLLPYIQSRNTRPTPYPSDSGYMLASPDQIAYARRAFGADTSQFVRELLRRLRAATPGELVALPSSGASQGADVETLGPPRVAVIVDGGTVSAAEVLVLKALRSTRAKVIGQPTKGALDYQSVNIVRIHPEENRWFLGYPTITASRKLPTGGMRGSGIQPDIVADVVGLWEGILAAERVLAP
jgi:hypothetical protein